MTRIWDLPTRLFHGLLIVLVVLQYGTADFGWLDMEWHVRFGYATLALIVFRVLWGVCGSQTSRFTEFVRGPRAVLRHVRTLFSAERHVSVGHNALGGWSVVALLLSVFVQAVSGLFASDGIDTDGPLAGRVASATVKLCTRIHAWNENILLALIALHVVAIVLYALLRGENLVTPMLTGVRVVDVPPPRFVGLRRAVALFVLCVAAVSALTWWAAR